MPTEPSQLVEIRVPQLSESVTEATLLDWRKEVGEAVSEGENLIDVETDKVVLELPAPSSGVLVEILRQEGDKVAGGEIIARLNTAKGAASVKPAARPAAKPEAAKTAAAMPAAQKIAAEKGVDTATIKGSGRDGRILKEDVLFAAQKNAVANIENRGARIEKRVPMTRIRQRIAERLLQSQQNAAILTTFNEVNMQQVMELRSRYKDAFEKKHGVKLGFSSFFVKAACAALQQFPVVNASVDGSDIIYHGYYDIGVAIGSERGLAVPIIRDADRLSLAGIEKQIADFSARAKEGRLTLEELSGGTFSITNGGVFGSMLSTPIINPPQSAILGIHATKDRPVAENGQVVIRPMNYLALSYDHRIVDGRDAVLFLAAIKEALEFPGRALLDL